MSRRPVPKRNGFHLPLARQLLQQSVGGSKGVLAGSDESRAMLVQFAGLANSPMCQVFLEIPLIDEQNH